MLAVVVAEDGIQTVPLVLVEVAEVVMVVAILPATGFLALQIQAVVAVVAVKTLLVVHLVVQVVLAL
jgi:hypothetical protein